MKALVKTARGPGNLEIKDMPDPVCGNDEVKIEVVACGVCGTDIHIQKDEFPTTPPVIIGHEFCGRVAEVGKSVTKYKPGDRVTAENVCLNCGGECYMCRSGHYAICVKRGAQGLNVHGAFAKYIVCKERNVYRIPDNISFEEGALSEPMVCSVHAVLDQTKVSAGDLVVIAGPGAIGLLAAQVAKAEGGTVILSGTTADEERFVLARKLGIDRTVDVLKEDLGKIVLELSGRAFALEHHNGRKPSMRILISSSQAARLRFWRRLVLTLSVVSERIRFSTIFLSKDRFCGALSFLTWLPSSPKFTSSIQ